MKPSGIAEALAKVPKVMPGKLIDRTRDGLGKISEKYFGYNVQRTSRERDSVVKEYMTP